MAFLPHSSSPLFSTSTMDAPSSNIHSNHVYTTFFDPRHHYALSQIRQTGLAIDYYLQFNLISQRVICMTEAAHLECFIFGLQEDICHEMMLLLSNYIFQAFQWALQLEAFGHLNHHRPYHTIDSAPLFSTQELLAVAKDVSVTTTNSTIPATNELGKKLVDAEKFLEATPGQDPSSIPLLIPQYPLPPYNSDLPTPVPAETPRPIGLRPLLVNTTVIGADDTNKPHDEGGAVAVPVSAINKVSKDLGPRTLVLAPLPLNIAPTTSLNSSRLCSTVVFFTSDPPRPAGLEFPTFACVASIPLPKKMTANSSMPPRQTAFIFDPGGALRSVSNPVVRCRPLTRVSVKRVPVLFGSVGAFSRVVSFPMMVSLYGSTSGWPWVPWCFATKGNIRVWELHVHSCWVFSAILIWALIFVLGHLQSNPIKFFGSLHS